MSSGWGLFWQVLSALETAWYGLCPQHVKASQAASAISFGQKLKSLIVRIVEEQKKCGRKVAEQHRYLEKVHQQWTTDHDEIQQANGAAGKQGVQQPGGMQQPSLQDHDLAVIASSTRLLLCMRERHETSHSKCLLFVHSLLPDPHHSWHVLAHHDCSSYEDVADCTASVSADMTAFEISQMRTELC